KNGNSTRKRASMGRCYGTRVDVVEPRSGRDGSRLENMPPLTIELGEYRHSPAVLSLPKRDTSDTARQPEKIANRLGHRPGCETDRTSLSQRSLMRWILTGEIWTAIRFSKRGLRRAWT